MPNRKLEFLMGKQIKRLLAIMFVATAAVGVIGGVILTNLFTQPIGNPLVCVDDLSQCPVTTPNTRSYYADRLLLIGTDNNDQRFHLDLLLIRDQSSSGSYTHYYELNYMINNQVDKLASSNNSPLESVQQFGFVSDYRYEQNVQEARDSYQIGLEFNGDSYEIELLSMNNDFAVKAHPDYTRLQSAGMGSVSINGESFTVNAITSRI